VYAFATGWLVSELSPQILAATAADTALHLAHPGRGRRRSRLGVLLALGTMAVHANRLRASVRTPDILEAAVRDSLSTQHAAELVALGDLDRTWPRRESVRPFAFRNAHVRVERDIAYSDHGRRTMLDVYAPADVTELHDAPVLLQVHGGAWTIGRKEQQGQPLMYEMAARGWVCVAINYRLAPRDPFPAQVIDVKRAIAWVKDNIASYGGDPDYVAITGGSAGGHLAALAALTPNDPAYQPGFADADTSVQLAVPHYGVYDMAGSTGLASAVAMRDGFLAPKVFLRTWDSDPDAFEAASPILRITPDAPDFFVLHGDNDTLVDVNQARLFVERLREVSRNSVSYAEFPGTQHAYEIFNSVRSAHVTRSVSRYLRAHRAAWLAEHRDRVAAG
jgi:acetyl esterase/lipase